MRRGSQRDDDSFADGVGFLRAQRSVQCSDVVAVLVVNILELSLHMTFNTPVDLVFASMAPLACAGALALLHLSAGGKHEDGAHGKKTMRSRKSRRDHERSMDEEAARHSAAAAGAR